MEFIMFIHETPLFAAINNENLDIIKLLLSRPEIDVNIRAIMN